MVKLTQREIAKKTGVSQTTVSLVLKDPESPRVSPDTRRRVLDFVRDNAPGTLRRRPGDALCYLVSAHVTRTWQYDIFYSALLHGAEAAARALRRDLVFRTFEEPSELSDLHARSDFGGVLLVNRLDPAWVERLQARGPVVQVNDTEPEPLCDQVSIDNSGAIRRAVQYLAQRGHRHIAYLGICKADGVIDSTIALRRLAGYYEGLHQCGLPVREAFVRQLPAAESMADSMGLTLHCLLQESPRPTAILAFNDYIALDLMQAAKALGLAVPADLSIIGFDNIETSALVHPAMTSIAQDRESMGRVAVELLDRRIRGQDSGSPQTILCGTRLIERDSVAAAPGAVAHGIEAGAAHAAS